MSEKQRFHYQPHGYQNVSAILVEVSPQDNLDQGPENGQFSQIAWRKNVSEIKNNISQ